MKWLPRDPSVYPATSNPHAAWLIQRAREECAGCRASWRLFGTVHKTGLPEPHECTAIAPRSILRRIAFNSRRDTV